MAKEPVSPPKHITKKHLARLEKERIQQRNIRFAAGVVIGLILVIIAYGVLDQTILKNIRPVAKVGSAEISTGDFQKAVKYNRYQMIEQLKQFSSNSLYSQFFGSYIEQIRSQLSSPDTLGQQVLDSLVEDRLVEQEAQKRGITVSDSELDKAVEEAFGYFPNGTPTPTQSPTPYDTPTLSATQQALLPPTSTPTVNPTETAAANAAATTSANAAATAGATEAGTPGATPTSGATATPAATATITPTATPYTRQGFEKNYNDYATNLKSINYSKDDLRKLIRMDLLKKKVFDVITADVKPEQEQVWARHLLVASEDEAKKAIDRLNNGEKFADLANELSQDTASKANGGDLGWFIRGKMVKPFEDAAFNLKVGEISQPVKSDFGYHVIQVLGHEVRPLTTEQMTEARQKAYQDWLAEAKEAANVQTYDISKVIPTVPTLPPELQNPQQQSAPIPDTPQ